MAWARHVTCTRDDVDKSQWKRPLGRLDAGEKVKQSRYRPGVAQWVPGS